MAIPDETAASGFVSSFDRAANVWTWTLTTRVGALLQEAEDRFGPVVSTYRYVGVEFRKGEGPSIWYPDNRRVAIVLNGAAISNVRLALWQAAHETIHLLSPTGGAQTTTLEEGLATAFQMEINDRLQLGMPAMCQANYQRARELVEQLLALDPNAVRRIRAVQPVMAKITPADIAATGMYVPDFRAQELCAPFAY